MAHHGLVGWHGGRDVVKALSSRQLEGRRPDLGGLLTPESGSVAAAAFEDGG